MADFYLKTLKWPFKSGNRVSRVSIDNMIYENETYINEIIYLLSETLKGLNPLKNQFK